MPSRWALESRPLRDDEAPFFFDMGDRPLALRDAGDLDRGVVLAVAPRPALVRLVLVREAADLRALGPTDDPGGDRGARQRARGRQHSVAVDDEDRLEGHVFAVEQLDVEPVALGDAVLLAAGLDHCVHAGP